MTEPNESFIPREVPENIKDTLDNFSLTLDEYVNFGSLILQWDEKPKTPGEENLAPTMLYRHFLDVIDSISILIKNGCGDTAKILMRSAFEGCLQLVYLLEKDSHNRGMAYLYFNTLEQIREMKKFAVSTEEGRQFAALIKKEGTLQGINFDDEKDVSKYISEKNRSLNLPQFENCKSDYVKKKKDKGKVLNWYSFFNGPKNFQALAGYLKQGTNYDILYRRWSGSVHGSDIITGRVFSDGKDIIKSFNFDISRTFRRLFNIL